MFAQHLVLRLPSIGLGPLIARRDGAVRVVKVAIALCSFLAACGGSDDPQGGAPAGRQAEAATATDGSRDTVNVILDEYWIGMPAVLPAGRTVLRLKSQGFEEHNLLFVLKQADSVVWETEGRLSPFESRIVTLDFDPGTYMAVCDFSGHEGRGMFLDFTVEAGLSSGSR